MGIVIDALNPHEDLRGLSVFFEYAGKNNVNFYVGVLTFPV